MEVTKDKIEDMFESVADSLREGLRKNIADMCGFTVMVSEEVPPGEVWFYDSNKSRHVLKNVKGFDITFDKPPF